MENLTHFNQEIQITVSVDVIAMKLLQSMNHENPHAILIVNTIIGQAIANDRKNDISRIYNALSGFESKVNFTVGQTLYSTDSVYDSKNNTSHKSREMGICKVTSVDPLKDRVNVEVEFDKYSRTDKFELQRTWVRIEDLREIIESDVVDLEPEEKTGE